MTNNTENINWLAAKLEPLIPREVAHCKAVREILDDDNRTLFDIEFRARAADLLGDVRDVPLFSLPPRSIGQGEFKLGNCVYGVERWPVGLPAGDLLRG